LEVIVPITVAACCWTCFNASKSLNDYGVIEYAEVYCQEHHKDVRSWNVCEKFDNCGVLGG
jgi:hypothetical protein